MTQGKVAAGGVIRPEGERIDQAFSAFLDTRSISFLLSASICTSKLATPYLAGAMNARATLAHIFWLPFMYVFLVAAQATVEQAIVHEAEITEARVDEAAGGVCRPEGEAIAQACFAYLDRSSVSFFFLVLFLFEFAHPNLPQYLAGAMSPAHVCIHVCCHI